MNEREFVGMTARMDGERVIAKNIGGKRKVSEMELVAICTFARVGLLSVFSNLEGETGEQAESEMARLIEQIRIEFGADKNRDGLMLLATTCAAILGGERLGRYVVQAETPA